MILIKNILKSGDIFIIVFKYFLDYDFVSTIKRGEEPCLLLIRIIPPRFLVRLV